MNGCDSRSMLDRYIYDYMIKKQMRETPEIFRREATLTFETALPGGLIFGDSFVGLKEWPSTKANHLPQNPVPLPYQQNPSTFSSTLNPVVVTDHLMPQGGAHLMPPGLESRILSSWKSEDHKKITVFSRLAESSRKRKASSEGNFGMPGFFLLHAENSEDNPSDLSAEANSSHINEMNGEANVSSGTSEIF